jgi:hypothetical protein
LSRLNLSEDVVVSVAAQVFVRGGGELDGAEHYVHTANGSDKRILAAHLCHPACTCAFSDKTYKEDPNCALGFSEHVLRPGDLMSINNFTYGVHFDPSRHLLRYAENLEGVPVEFTTFIQASKVWRGQNQKFDKRTGRALNPYSMDMATFYQQPTQSECFSDKVPVKGAVWRRDQSGKYTTSADVEWVSPYAGIDSDEAYIDACNEKIRRERLPQTIDDDIAVATQADLNLAEVNAAFKMDKSDNKQDTKDMFTSKALYGSSNAAHTAAARDMRIVRGPHKRGTVDGETQTVSAARRNKKMRQRAQFA